MSISPWVKDKEKRKAREATEKAGKKK